MNTKWLYFGCNLSELPNNFLEDSKKLSKDEIKVILNSIPIVNGVTSAVSENELIKLLINNGIYPIRIKKCNNIDNRILRLKNIRNMLSNRSK
jgi:hypothetical protein